jgi:hypothetical protein
MRAYKFLRPGAVGPFSGQSWPVPADGGPGAWVRADAADPMLCRTGVHACTLEHLPYWIAEELWEVELEGPVEEQRSKLVAPAGRLVARVEAWDEDAAVAFMDATVERIRALDTGGYMTEAEIFCVGEAGRSDPMGNAALSTMIAVEAAEHAGGPSAVRVERAREATWLADRLSLAETAAGF